MGSGKWERKDREGCYYYYRHSFFSVFVRVLGGLK